MTNAYFRRRVRNRMPSLAASKSKCDHALLAIPTNFCKNKSLSQPCQKR